MRHKTSLQSHTSFERRLKIAVFATFCISSRHIIYVTTSPNMAKPSLATLDQIIGQHDRSRTFRILGEDGRRPYKTLPVASCCVGSSLIVKGADGKDFVRRRGVCAGAVSLPTTRRGIRFMICRAP